MTFKPRLSEAIKYVLKAIVISVLYFYIAEISFLITRTPNQTSAFFIPSGFAIAVLLLLGSRYLPIIFLAKFAVGLSRDRWFAFNILSSLASATEAYIGYYLYKSFKESLEKVFEFQSDTWMILTISIIAPIFSALIGVTNLYYMGAIQEDGYFSHFITWYAGDLLGILIFLPAFLSFNVRTYRFFDLLAPIFAFCFTYLFKFKLLDAYLFTIFLTLLIPAILGSAIGVYSSLVVISLVLNWFLINHTGPFSLGNYIDNLASMQFFLIALGITSLALVGLKKTKILKSALVPLLSFWFLTGLVYFYYHNQKDITNTQIMNDTIDNFSERLNEKMHFYENAIKGASGFVVGSEEVLKAEWDEYFRSINIVDYDNGVRGAVLILPIAKNHLDRTYVYPGNINYNNNFHNLPNQPDLKNVFEEAILRQTPILTQPSKFKLDGNTESMISFLIISVKKNNNFFGWIVIPMEMTNFFKSMAVSKYPSIDIDVYDGQTNSSSQKVYSKIVDGRLRTTESVNTRLSTLMLADHPFTIDWNETLRYVTPQNSQNSLFILVGAIFSCVVTGFILKLKLIGVRANKVADSKTLALHESEERFKSLFENSSDAVILFNNHEIIDCNPESLKVFGKKTKKNLLDMPLFEFFSIRDIDSATDKDIFSAKVNEVKYKKMLKFECFCLRGGLPFFAEMHLHYIEVNDKFIFQAVVRDISERKKIELNLLKSKELAEDAAQAKTNFLSTMSHEIRTPLNGVIGMVNIILDENPNLDIREDLETIKYSADSLLHIVNEVLDYNKIESGKIILEKKPFNLKKMADNILKSHRPVALEKSLNLSLDIDPEIPEIVIGDEYRNTQILNNLLNNSLKFTDKGSVSLKIRLKQKKDDSCKIEFRVVDTGIGIDKDRQRDIFKDFTQAEIDHTRKYGGTGLGLAITKRLIEIQNGMVEVSSIPGEGTTFTYIIAFNLKSGSPIPVSSNPTQKIQDSFNGERVLLVEDNQVNIIVTRKFLEKWGLQVDVAVNGLEAVNNVQKNRYDIILMDLHMPLMDGFHATKKIREFNKETPIIGLSADVMTESVSSLQAIGMNDFVTKPFKPNDFFNKLKTFI